ncbi:MAG: preprotein translocase subunit SecG [Acholeplasmataceae bacterium]
MIWVDYIAIVAAILLIGSALIQSSDDDIKDAFSGEKSELFKDQKIRGFELFMTRATLVIAIIFVVAVIWSNAAPRGTLG